MRKLALALVVAVAPVLACGRAREHEGGRFHFHTQRDEVLVEPFYLGSPSLPPPPPDSPPIPPLPPYPPNWPPFPPIPPNPPPAPPSPPSSPPDPPHPPHLPPAPPSPPAPPAPPVGPPPHGDWMDERYAPLCSWCLRHRCLTASNRCARSHGLQYPHTWQKDSCMCSCCHVQCRHYGRDRCGHDAAADAGATDFAALVPSAAVPNPYCTGANVHADAWIFKGASCRQVCLPFKWTNVARKHGLRYEGYCWEMGCAAWKGKGKQTGVTFHEFECAAGALQSDAAARRRAGLGPETSDTARGAPPRRFPAAAILGGGLTVGAVVALALASAHSSLRRAGGRLASIQS